MIWPLLLACSGEGPGLAWRESWELLSLNPDRSLLELRWTRDNTGLQRGEGHARGAFARKGESSLLFGYDAWPEQVSVGEDGSVRFGPDSLQRSGADWLVSWSEGEYTESYRTVRLTLSHSGIEVPAWEEPGWTMEVLEPRGELQGFISSNKQEELVTGRAVLLHRFGDQPPEPREAPRRAAFINTARLSIGVDQAGSRLLAWAVVDGLPLPAGDAVITEGPEGSLQLDFRPGAPLTVELLPRDPAIEDDPYVHLTGLERAALDARSGLPLRRLRSAVAHVVVAGEALQAPAMVLEVEAR